jgi:hypothetical protein
MFATRVQIKLHLQQWTRASAAPRAPRERLVHNGVDRHTFVEQVGRMHLAEMVELEVHETERIGALARVCRSHLRARDAGISKPQCVTGNASPPPNFEGSS